MNLTVKGRHRDTDLYPPVLASLTVGFHLRTSPPRSAVIPQQHRLDQGGGWKSLSGQTPPCTPSQLGLIRPQEFAAETGKRH